MKNFPSLKSNKDFQNVYKNGKSFANKHFVMYVLKNDIKINRIGISVSKKVGNSVLRHTLTRRTREIFRLVGKKESYDFILVIRKEAKEVNFEKLKASFIHLLNLHSLSL